MQNNNDNESDKLIDLAERFIFLGLHDYDKPPASIGVGKEISEATSSVSDLSFDNGVEYLHWIIKNREGDDLELFPEINDPIVGDEDSVGALRPHGRGRSKRRIEYLGTIHGHPNLSPPSFPDLNGILNSGDKFAVVATGDVSYLFVSSGETEIVDGYERWEEDQWSEYREQLRSLDLSGDEEDLDQIVDEIIWNQTYELCERHKILVYRSSDAENYQFLS